MQRDAGKPLFDVLLMAVSAAAFVAAAGLPDVDIVGDLSPAFFPKLLSGLVFLCAIPCVISDFREWRQAGRQEIAAGGHRGRFVAQWLFVVLLLAAYTLMFERFGYILSTSLFTFCCVVGLIILSGVWAQQRMTQRVTSLLAAALFAVVLAVAVFYVFNDLFEIPLPA